jgi:hypothetical protein
MTRVVLRQGTHRNRPVRDTRADLPAVPSLHPTHITPSRVQHHGTRRSGRAIAPPECLIGAGQSTATRIRSQVVFRPGRGALARPITARIAPASIRVGAGIGSGAGRGSGVAAAGPGFIAQDGAARCRIRR